MLPLTRVVAPLALVAAMLAALVVLAGASLVSYAAPVAAPVVHVQQAGDDNGDGYIDEDESGWRCWVHGNRVCSSVALPGR